MTLLSSRARIASALILSLIDKAVKVTPANPCIDFFFRRLKIQAIITAKTTSAVTPPTAPAKAAVCDLGGTFVTVSAVEKSTVRNIYCIKHEVTLLLIFFK